MTPELLKSKAERKLKDVFRAMIRGEDIFPLLVPLAKPKTTSTISELRDFIQAVHSQSKGCLGFGYTIEEQVIKTRQHGKNCIPVRLTFETANDFLRYVGAEKDFSRLMKNVGLVCSLFPEARDWCASHLKHMLQEQDVVVFATRVVEYLKTNRCPEVFARQLPISVPSKFIESNTSFVESLLMEVSPASFVNLEGSFEERVGLLTKESLIEFKSLDHRCSRPPFSHSMATARELAKSQDLFREFDTVLIIENHVPFLTAPSLTGTLAVMGSGYAVRRLREVEWLSEKSIFYWGDIDISGFEILSKIREHFPQVVSVLMDLETYTGHAGFQNPCTAQQSIASKSLVLLTSDERELVELLSDPQSLRLEQEHVAFEYVSKELARRIGVDAFAR